MKPVRSIDLANGTEVMVMPWGTSIRLPSGKLVKGLVQGSEEQLETARRFGYGDETLAMVLDHDPLHALLNDWLGGDASYSLSYQAGDLPRSEVWRGKLEEAAVCAVQTYWRRCGLPGPEKLR